ncbi:hypothetical protein E2C01_005143 [Portunus trituberculatus]|uniref:Uncharacterized protein n=1 Tax=Portunus trituberculatus TaxID=210409 RepID=A0A5B7CRL7_PORTR|nr:hypothetical protein [Portunus trituberculatus]
MKFLIKIIKSGIPLSALQRHNYEVSKKVTTNLVAALGSEEMWCNVNSAPSTRGVSWFLWDHLLTKEQQHPGTSWGQIHNRRLRALGYHSLFFETQAMCLALQLFLVAILKP